jgi:Kef-type K+ transport system membrane component KefB
MAAIVAGFLLFKCLVIFTLARLMDLPFQDRPVFTLLLAQGGEFAFVVFQAAAGRQVFPPETASLLIGCGRGVDAGVAAAAGGARQMAAAALCRAQQAGDWKKSPSHRRPRC